MRAMIIDFSNWFAKDPTGNLGSIDAWALGICIGVGGQYFGWNFGLAAGFGSFMIANFLVGLGYLCLVFSLLELTCAIPFPGKRA